MKKTISRLPYIAICAAMLLAFAAGCSSETPAPSSGAPQDSPGSSPQISVGLPPIIDVEEFDPTVGGETGPKVEFVKYDPPIDVEMLKVLYAIHPTSYASIGETADDNRWIDVFREELGINIRYQFVASAGDAFDIKMQMMLASNDMADIFQANLGIMSQLSEAGRIWDMTEYFSDYIAPVASNVIMADGGGSYESCIIDGKLWGVPEVTSAYDTLRWLYIRRDWMEKFSLAPPESIDDLMNIMRIFVEQDPDGNGQNDTFATYIDRNFWTQLEGFFWMYGAYPNAFVERGGRLQYGAILPEAKEALRSVQRMYLDGWLDPEFFIKDFSKAKEIVTQGKVGVVMGYHWLPFDVTGPMNEQFPDVEWDIYPFPTAQKGVPATVMMQSGLRDALVVDKTFSHPEAAVAMVNLYCEKIFGLSSVTEYDIYGVDKATGTRTDDLGPLYMIHPYINLNPYRDCIRIYNGELTLEEVSIDSRRYWENCYGPNSNWAERTMWGPGAHTVGVVLDFLVRNPQYMIQNAYMSTPTETQAERGSILDEMRNSAYSQIMSGRIDVDEGFDKFVEEYLKAGGQAIEDEVNRWYAANN